jgi:cation diffusion facilitator CzcD-associated flavoprotein CzcO
MQRFYFMLTSRLFFLFCRSMPGSARWLLRQQVHSLLLRNVPCDPHFVPRYNPWEQRLCLCPDGDFFKSLHSGRVQIKTDTIHTVTPAGIKLSSGEHIKADAIVTATGLRLQVAGGVHLTIDGLPHNLPSKYL